MKVVAFFVASLIGGSVLGGAVRGFMMDPPVVEEEAVEGIEVDPGAESLQAHPDAEAEAGATHAVGEASDEAVAVEDGDQGGSVEGHEVSADEGVNPVNIASTHEEDDGSAEDQAVPEATVDPVVDAAAAQTTQGVTAQPTDVPPPGSPGAGEVDSGAQERLAQIFGSMDAKAAASVLVELSDSEITEILGHLSARKAGEVIKNMPPGRAAILSRVMLVGAGAGS